MKRKLLALFLLTFLSAASVMQAQAPQAVTLQSVLRDAAGRLVANRNVGVRITLRQTSAMGPVVYQETHTPTTNQNGLYTVFFGQGTPTSGTFPGINWANGPFYATVEADPNGGNNYTLTVNHPIVSVPYALYAEQAKEMQVLAYSNDTLYLRGGNTTTWVYLPAGGGGGGPVGCVPSCGRVDTIEHKLDSLINISCVTSINIISKTECDSYNWPLTEQTYYSSGSYSKLLPKANAKGCDSIVILSLTINKSTHNVENQEATGFYLWNGTNYTTSGTKVRTYTNALGCASADTLKLKVNTLGLMKGEFAIASGKKVKFSRGNLQYRASMNIWRFAERQYDYVGAANGTVYVGTSTTKSSNNSLSNTYDGWIDLFGWGTSNSPNASDAYYTRYRPWDNATATVNGSYNYYGYGPSTNMISQNLTGGSANGDWGVVNPISNGGNQAGLWRTLTYAEWNYLLSTRSASTVCGTANARFCLATVAGIGGMILFPDNYIHPESGLQLRNINGSPAYADNNILEAGWVDMEAAGAIFLPAAGYRSGTSTSYANSYGYYWTATYYNYQNAYFVYFYSGYRAPTTYTGRYMGAAVRLVQDVN